MPYADPVKRRKTALMWKRKNPDKVKQYYLKNRKVVERRAREREGLYPPDPIKREARRVLVKAVKRGKIFKPNSCSICGKELPKTSIHGHHADHTRPLDVIWVCSTCHGLLHRKI